MERFCQPERLLVWSELDRETSKRQILTIPIQALTGRDTLFQPFSLSCPVAEYPCCGEDAFISQSWMTSNVHFLWPMPWSWFLPHQATPWVRNLISCVVGPERKEACIGKCEASVTLEVIFLTLNWRLAFWYYRFVPLSLVSMQMPPDADRLSGCWQGDQLGWGDFISVQLPCPGAPSRYHSFPFSVWSWFNLMLSLEILECSNRFCVCGRVCAPVWWVRSSG